MDTDSFIVHIKTKDVYKDIANNLEKRFDTSNYGIERRLSVGKNKKVIGLTKHELGVKIMTEFVGFRPKTYSYLMNYGSHDKKIKEKKMGDKKNT